MHCTQGGQRTRTLRRCGRPQGPAPHPNAANMNIKNGHLVQDPADAGARRAPAEASARIINSSRCSPRSHLGDEHGCSHDRSRLGELHESQQVHSLILGFFQQSVYPSMVTPAGIAD